MATTIERPAAAPVVNVPDQFNVADYLVDRHVRDARGGRTAILCGDESVTYAQVAERSNRVGNGLRSLGVRREERVLLLLLDTPAFAYSFFGAQKIGAVPIPTNTLLKSQDYRYMLNDSRATVAIVSEPLLAQLAAIPRDELPYLQHMVIDGVPTAGATGFEQLLAASPTLEPEPTSKDGAAFWLYSSGTTGFPKGAVHLHHDIVHTVVCYAQGILRMTADDRTFSVAKLFFAYGLGNALTFPFAVGATTSSGPGRRLRRMSIRRSSDTSRRSSILFRPITGNSWHTSGRAPTSIYPAFGRRCRPGKRCRRPSTNASRIALAWRSSTVLAAPRSCTSYSPTDRVASVPAPLANWCRATRRGSSMRPVMTSRTAPSATW